MKPLTLEWINLAEGDWGTANRELAVRVDTNFKAVSFHAQQCGEKYLKAYLQEINHEPERTHDLNFLLDKILPHMPTWENLRDSCHILTDFAVDHRYPGTTTSHAEAISAVQHAGLVRRAVRAALSQ